MYVTRTPFVGLVISAIGAVVGVTSLAADGGSVEPAPLPISDVAAPEFTGAWAAELEQTWSYALDAEIRAMFDDEQFSADELATVQERFRVCAESRGITSIEFHEGGSFNFGFASEMGSARAGALVSDCARSEGVDAVNSLYYAMLTNPNNIDRTPEIVDCIVRSGTVEPEFSETEYRDGRIAAFAANDAMSAYAALTSCEVDPSR